MKKNDLEAAFLNITKLTPEVVNPFPTEVDEDPETSAENVKEAQVKAEEEKEHDESPVLLKRKEQKELRNVRKQFVITESLNSKLKEKSRELNLSENEVICQLLAIM